MKKFTTDIGYVVYRITKPELESVDCGNICDFCNTAVNKGYLIPVLNQFVCDGCFEDWKDRGKYCEEDIGHETKISQYYESMIEVE